MAPAVAVEAIGKRYLLGEHTSYRTLRDTLASLASRDRPERRELWALRDVSFSVPQGGATAIIGRNGAGKTTMLKILARITEPTEGRAITYGKVASLLDIGTGFHRELTGRDNVYLNGAVLGMSRADIRRRYDEIVDFAGTGAFMGTPLKRYSVGMELRLAFSIAAHLEADVLVVDEVLAVGDAEFQRRCLGKISTLSSEGRAVVFVSHDLGAVARLCDTALWLEHGRVRDQGDTRMVIDRYIGSIVTQDLRAEFDDATDGPVGLRAVELRAPSGQPRRDEPFDVLVSFVAREHVPGLDVAITLTNWSGTVVLSEHWLDSADRNPSIGGPGLYETRLGVPPILAPGQYLLTVVVGEQHEAFEAFVERDVFGFDLLPAFDDAERLLARDRAIMPRATWSLSHEREAE